MKVGDYPKTYLMLQLERSLRLNQIFYFNSNKKKKTEANATAIKVLQEQVAVIQIKKKGGSDNQNEDKGDNSTERGDGSVNCDLGLISSSSETHEILDQSIKLNKRVLIFSHIFPF